MKGFSLDYKDIALSNATGKNEVALEFQQTDTSAEVKKMDMLCEMRFYVPNNELDLKKKEKAEEKKKNKKDDDQQENQGEGQDNQEESEEEETPAKLLNDKIIKAAGIGQFAGQVITSI